jgi:PGF-CTERM protein
VEYVDGNAFQAELTLAAESNLTADGRVEAASDRFALEVRKAHLSVGDEVSRVLYANPALNQTIRGETNVEPGLNVTVVVRRSDDPSTAENESDVRAKTVQVRDGGPDESPEFTATFDFGDVPQNATARLDVRHDGRSILGANATLVVVEPTADLAVHEVEPNATGPYARVRADADLSRGGFVVLHRGSADGPVVGSSRYLERGPHSNVTVYVGEHVEESGRLVAVVHRDGNYNRWFDGPDRDPAYVADGPVAVETDYVLRPTATSPVTRTTTPTLAATDTESGSFSTATTTSTAETPTAGPIPTGVPGFGVASAVTALIVIGALAIRRQ